MVKQSVSGQFGIRARQFPQAIRFLRALDVPASRLAGIFNTTSDNIRHIDSRAYSAIQASFAPPLLDGDDRQLLKLSEARRLAQVRRNLQGIRLRSKADSKLAEETVWAISQNHRTAHLKEGYAALRLLLPSTANAQHGHGLYVRLLLQERLGWFALNLNLIDEALVHERAAMELALTAFRESAGEKSYLLRYSEAALIASVCSQKRHNPRASHSFIKAANDAHEAANMVPGSEHLRQFGTALLQLMGHDDRAVRAFNSAVQRMQDKDETSHPVDLRMTGLRQRALLTPARDWDDTQLMVLEVASVYGRQSVQCDVATRFTAAAGFKLNTPSSILVAQGLLSAQPDSPLASILAITPELKLRGEALDRWLRFALYEAPSPH